MSYCQTCGHKWKFCTCQTPPSDANMWAWYHQQIAAKMTRQPPTATWLAATTPSAIERCLPRQGRQMYETPEGANAIAIHVSGHDWSLAIVADDGSTRPYVQQCHVDGVR
jgi:hypothetical protein